jgi:hypothetical protein
MLFLDHVSGDILHYFVINFNQNSNVYSSTSRSSEQVYNSITFRPIERIDGCEECLYVKSCCFDALSYKLQYWRWILYSFDIFSLNTMFHFFDLVPCWYSVIQQIVKQILLQPDEREIFRNEMSMVSSHFIIRIFYVVEIRFPIYNAEISTWSIRVIYAEFPCQLFG